MSDWLQYQEFLRFKQMQTMSAANAAPSWRAPSGALSVAAPSFLRQTFPPLQRTAAPAPVPLKIDYSKAMHHLLAKMGVGKESQHFGLWWHFKNLYDEFPERFSLMGEPHGVGELYISFRYTPPSGKYITFHAYGRIDGVRFVFTRADIKIGDQVYENAWRYSNSETASVASE